MATRATTGIKRRGYQVLTRDVIAGAGDVPADLTAWTTFLGTFTDLGFHQLDTLDLPISIQETVVLDDSQDLTISWELEGEFLLVQTEAAAIAEYDALNNKSQDVLFHAPLASPERALVLPNIVLGLLPRIGGDQIDAYNATVVKRNAGDPSDIFSHYDVPIV